MSLKTVHRRFQARFHTGLLQGVLEDGADEAKQQDLFDGSEAYVEAAILEVKSGGAGNGTPRRARA